MALLAVGTAPAMAHTHPTPIERASPGVVYIEARAKVEVALIEHRQAGDSFGVHIGIIQSTWNPVLATASGFVVDPTGGIVTTGSITRTDLDRARIFAVNQAFHQRYFDAAPLPKDPFSRNRLGGSGDRNEERLEACYPPNRTNDAGGCVVRVTPDYVVYPYVTSQQRYGALHAELLPGGTKDVAVLRVRGANSMPTVAVGTSTAGAKALGVLGFTGIPGPANPLVEVNQHLATEGGKSLKTTGLDAEDVRDAAKLSAALNQGMAGGPVLAERGQVIGLLPSAPPPGSAAPPLVTIDSVLPVLAKAGVSPHGGPVDTSFEAAMHLFKNGGYAASVPGFTKALELFPGHFLASPEARHRQAACGVGQHGPGTTAQGTVNGTGAGTSAAADSTSGGMSWLWLVGLLIVAALVATAAVLLVRRRRQGGAEAAAAGPTTGRPTSGGRRPPGSPPGGAPPAGGAAAAGAVAAATGAAAAGRAAGPSQRSQQQSTCTRPRSRGPRRTGPSRRSHPATAGRTRGRPSTAGTTRRPGARARPVPGAPPQPGPGAAPGDHLRRAPVRGRGPNASRSAAAVAAPGAAGGADRGPQRIRRRTRRRERPGSTSSRGPRFCTACGGRLAAQHQFCGWCGEPVG